MENSNIDFNKVGEHRTQDYELDYTSIIMQHLNRITKLSDRLGTPDYNLKRAYLFAVDQLNDFLHPYIDEQTGDKIKELYAKLTRKENIKDSDEYIYSRNVLRSLIRWLAKENFFDKGPGKQALPENKKQDGKRS